MTTYGLTGDSESFISTANASEVPPRNNDILAATSSELEDLGEFPADSLRRNCQVEDDEEYIEATQQQSQSQHVTYNAELNNDLVGSLISMEGTPFQFDLKKDTSSRVWTIGRAPSCDLRLNKFKISSVHCRLTWNGKSGQQSEVMLEDTSTNGTYIDKAYLKGGKTILRSGAQINLAGDTTCRFMFKDIEGSTVHTVRIASKYDILGELGSGAFARVHRCLERATGKEYAVKIIDRTRFRAQGTEDKLNREIFILERLANFNHNHIVSLVEYFDEDDMIYLILEYVKGGDLLTFIVSNAPIDENEVRRLTAQMCQAMAYVHSNDITHRDLKPENVLVTTSTVKERPDCKIADFGLAKLVDDQTFLRTMCGTPAYLAPEVILRTDHSQAYDNKVDSWSLGVIIFAMLTNTSPFNEGYDNEANDRRRREYFQNRTVNWQTVIGLGISRTGLEFLRDLLQQDMRRRKTISQMLDHPWIRNLVPTYSQVLVNSQSSSGSSVEQSDPNVCHQSFEQLRLSDGACMPIPGLGAPDATTGAVVSQDSVTVNMPGAYPKPQVDAMMTIDEAPLTSESWGCISVNGPTPNTPDPSPSTAAKRKIQIAGSSPLSSLSSDEDDDTSGAAAETLAKPVLRRPVIRRKNTPMPPSGRKTRGIPSNIKRAAPQDEDPSARQVNRRPPAKVARYA
ncbi:kinase-like domain-containing protein [Hysterangium stoloniferum]|nr:kinase-like domain-containing protein [Hysterangium stoloniferum]